MHAGLAQLPGPEEPRASQNGSAGWLMIPSHLPSHRPAGHARRPTHTETSSPRTQHLKTPRRGGDLRLATDGDKKLAVDSHQWGGLLAAGGQISVALDITTGARVGMGRHVGVSRWSPTHLRRAGPRWTMALETALKGVPDAGEKR